MCLILRKGGSDEIQENPFSLIAVVFFFPLLRLSVVLLHPTDNRVTQSVLFLASSSLQNMISEFPNRKAEYGGLYLSVNLPPSAGCMTGISLPVTSPRISGLINN